MFQFQVKSCVKNVLSLNEWKEKEFLYYIITNKIWIIKIKKYILFTQRDTSINPSIVNNFNVVLKNKLIVGNDLKITFRINRAFQKANSTYCKFLDFIVSIEFLNIRMTILTMKFFKNVWSIISFLRISTVFRS